MRGEARVGSSDSHPFSGSKSAPGARGGSSFPSTTQSHPADLMPPSWQRLLERASAGAGWA